MDAGDWIALGSLTVAAGSVLVGWWQAHKSADAAETSAGNAKESADAAAAMVPIAERTADAAAESARAANRSADVAEAQRWSNDAPQWEATIEPDGEKLTVKVTMLAGPAAIYATHFFMGKLWRTTDDQSQPEDVSRALSALQNWLPMTTPRPPITKGGGLTFRVASADIDRIEVTVMVASVEFQRAGEDPPPKPWVHAELLRWERPKEQPFFAAFA